MATQNLVDYVFSKYPTKNHETFREECEKSSENIKTWRDFANALAAHDSRDDTDMTVTKSSTWAVCQEFLGQLSGQDLEYSQTRGGLWSCEWDHIENECNIVSVRQILEDIQEVFPS